MCIGSSGEEGKCVKLDANGYPAITDSNIPSNSSLSKILGLNQRQTAIAKRLQDAVFNSNLFDLVTSVGTDSLLAYQSPYGYLLPPNQWTLEVENWFATVITALNLATTQFVTGFQRTRYNIEAVIERYAVSMASISFR
jgi:hypothetical protein